MFDVVFDIEEIDDGLYYYGSSYLIEQYSKKEGYICNVCGKCESIYDIEFEVCSICGMLCCIETGRFFESYISTCNNRDWFDNTDEDIWGKHYGYLTKHFETPFLEFCCYECIMETEEE